MDFEQLSGSPNENIRLVYMIVRATDWGTPSLFTDVPLFVYVEDVNDYAPMFEYESYNKSIPEDLPGATSILQVLSYLSV